MKKEYKIRFILLISMLFGFFTYQYFYKNADAEPLTSKERNTNLNPAREISLEGDRSYKVDNKEFKAGFYDIKSVKGNLSVGGILISQGDVILSRPFYLNNKISIKGKGVIHLTPAKFSKETFTKKSYQLSNKSVIYKAGVEIEPGTYTIQVFNQFNKRFYVFFDIKDINDNTLQTIDIKNSDIYTFTLKKGDEIKILNWSKDISDLTIDLKRIN
jgi:hypothetical protein